MDDYLKRLQQENEQLKNDNALLLSELKACRDDLSEEAEALTVIKKEMRRCDVQLNSLKTENEELKNKFAKIENNPIGRFLLKIYRWLRELKRRRGS
ncbi:MAG: hypothetical protein LUG85_00250 [Clostridiales bacterium]|nr:hypothetical protein [Clostridiales bacterium]MCD7826958.1 hypothetical protein [Clostridiales bacterium]